MDTFGTFVLGVNGGDGSRFVDKASTENIKCLVEYQSIYFPCIFGWQLPTATNRTRVVKSE
jgi:hypothetical protein